MVWLVGCFGFNGPLRQYFSLYRAVCQREGERGERIDESKNVQTTPTRIYCKRNRPLPYCYQNCRTPRHWKFTQHHRTTPTFLWKHINSLNGKTSEQRIPHELIIDNKPYNEISDIIEKLNHYFSTISAKLQIDHAQENLPFDLSKLTNYVDSKVPSNVKFQIPLMKLPDLISIIGSLNASKATGLDGITAKILKSSTEIICPSLLKIINISISTRIFPECLKQAKVIPVHKSGPYNDPANYRPISILPVLSKIIEKHVTKHLFAYLKKYGLLHKSQSGFRQNHSCNTALINLVDKWLSDIDKGEIIGAIFFDLRKAFDVVDHQLLIEKVNSYHFSNNSVNWIRSYLTDRQQCITEKTTRSSFQ